MGIPRLVTWLALVLLVPGMAAAQAPAQPPAPAATEPVRRGLIVQASFGGGDATGARYPGRLQTEPGFGGNVSGWFRPIEALAVGAELHYNAIGTGDFDSEGVETSMSTFDVGAGGRAYVPVEAKANAYGGLTFGYVQLGSSAEADGETSSARYRGLALGLQFGGEAYLGPYLSLGLLARFLIPFWLDVCFEYEGSAASSSECGSPDEVTGGHSEDLADMLWYLGGTFSLHLPLS